MSDVQTLKSYLVSLGFATNLQEFRQFENTLKSASGLVSGEIGKIAVDILKWQSAIVGMFASVTTSVIATMDKVAMADQEYRLFGERMFMDTNHAKSLKIALDALGQPLEAVAFDPELHDRFMQLQKDQKQMQGGLGGDFESNMRSMRDIRFEFTRFGVELQYLAMSATNSIFKALGLDSGSFLENLRHLNDWIIRNIPEMGKQFAEYLAPVLKDTWHIAKDLMEIFGLLAVHFSNLISVLSGDNSIAGQTFNFQKFAGAIEHCASAVAWLLDKLISLEKFLAPVGFAIGGAVSGASAGAAIGALGGPVGAGGGALIGGGVGLIADLIAGHHGAANAGSPVSTTGLSGLAAAVASIESGQHQFDRHGNIIASNKGALGIMQLMPKTAAGLGVNPYDAADNMRGGIKLLQQLSGHYHGNVDNVLAAYNWGQGNVDKALASGRAFPASVQGYVRDVKGRMGGGASSSVSVNVGDIHIMQPNASADEIASAVTKQIAAKQSRQVQRNMTQLAGAFQ